MGKKTPHTRKREKKMFRGTKGEKLFNRICKRNIHTSGPSTKKSNLSETSRKKYGMAERCKKSRGVKYNKKRGGRTVCPKSNWLKSSRTGIPLKDG